MISVKVTVNNKNGIHARPAAMIVKTTGKFTSEVYFSTGTDRVNAKSILGVIALGASYRTEITVMADGEDEQEAISAISQLFLENFE